MYGCLQRQDLKPDLPDSCGNGEVINTDDTIQWCYISFHTAGLYNCELKASLPLLYTAYYTWQTS